MNTNIHHLIIFSVIYKKSIIQFVIQATVKGPRDCILFCHKLLILIPADQINAYSKSIFKSSKYSSGYFL